MLVYSVYVRSSINARIYRVQLEKVKIAVSVVKDAKVDTIFSTLEMSDLVGKGDKEDGSSWNSRMFSDGDEQPLASRTNKRKKASQEYETLDEEDNVFSFRRKNVHKRQRVNTIQNSDTEDDDATSTTNSPSTTLARATLPSPKLISTSTSTTNQSNRNSVMELDSEVERMETSWRARNSNALKVWSFADFVDLTEDI